MPFVHKLFAALQALGLVGLILAGPVPNDQSTSLQSRTPPTPIQAAATHGRAVYKGRGGRPGQLGEANTVFGPDGEEFLQLQEAGWDNLEVDLDDGDDEDGEDSTCSIDDLRMRKEWRFMSHKNRKAWTDAVQCLTEIPAPSYYTDANAPGVKSLFDAFTAVHITHTPWIHGDALFFPWHRYFIWLFDQALRDECGYRGPTPYWDWGLDTADFAASPLFDGSPYSLGSNGAAIPNRTSTFVVAAPLPSVPPLGVGLTFPIGTGGGCVYEGPFSNLTIHLGPYGLSEVQALPNELGYNPRCLQRDLNPYILQHYNSFNWSSWTVTQSKDMSVFSGRVFGDGTPTLAGQGHENATLNIFGVHGGGHFSVGGQTGSMADFYASPQDPVFFLHHGAIDRIWTIWQNQDREDRLFQIYGTKTYENVPASANATLDTLLDYGPLADPITIEEAMSTTDGPFCYYYE